jgi:flagellum-specific ATP synthase
MSAAALRARLRATDPVQRTGRVRGVFSTHIEADGPNVPLGALCEVETRTLEGAGTLQAEVVRVAPDRIVLSPFDEAGATFAGATVAARGPANRVPVGRALLGRVVDALGRPVDGAGPVAADAHHPLHGTATGPLDRVSPARPLDTGVRAIDGLLTLGIGQRIGVFAASGVGKTSLMTQIARQTKADVTVVCLVGERGREVEAMWSQGLPADVRARTTMVAATSDQSAAMRVRAGHYGLALADYWRAEGAHVLLLLDSVTRLAMAMREIGLAAGEPPTVRAYTPGVFATIPRLVERCGALRAGGAITAVMTVLSETDDVDDPVSEMMKSLLDGHILLSRDLAEQGHFPAIDVPRSVSRQAEGLVAPAQREHARRVCEWLSIHAASRTLIDAGLYVKGANEALDQAIARHPDAVAFLRQARDHRAAPAETTAALARLAGEVK